MSKLNHSPLPVVIAGYARTPFTLAHKGAFAKVRPDDLLAAALRGLLQKLPIDPNQIEDVIAGCAFPEAEQGFNMARMVALLAGLPHSVGGVTVNRFCGSSMQAIHQAAGAIQLNAGEAFLCGGVESMTRIPMTGFNPAPNPQLYQTLPAAYLSMGQTAEYLAKTFAISRAAQDAFALHSQQKAAAAQAAGHFNDEIIAVGKVTQDGCIRADTTLEALASLKPAFDQHGTVTAGTASPLTDGASMTLVCSENFAREHGLPLLARIRSIAIAGCAPERMGLGPVAATHKALQRAGLSLADIDLIELNEAFAAQALACIQVLELEESRINLDGGALALGHPLGATGARITGKAAVLLQREGKQFALATQCIGGGQGIATILEAVS